MKFIDLQQNTAAWHRWREQRLGASDTLAIMGVETPWPDPMTAKLLWEYKTGRVQYPVPNTYAMRRGHRMEPRGRALAEQRTGLKFDPVCVEHDRIPWMAASLDGLDQWGEIVLEIKAPRKESHEEALAGEIPFYYRHQLAYQSLVTGIPTILYASISEHKDFTEAEQFALVEFSPSKDEIDALTLAVFRFWACVVFDIPPTTELIHGGISGSFRQTVRQVIGVEERGEIRPQTGVALQV